MVEVVLELLLGGAAFLDPAVLLESNGELEDWQALLIVAAMSFPIGAVAIKMGVGQYHKSRIVKNTSTERIRSMAIGRTELNGAARPYRKTYQQPFEEGECVYGKWRVEELVEKNPHDDDDDSQTWRAIRSGTLGGRIVLEDDTGAVIMEQPSMTYSDELTTDRKQGKLANVLEGGLLSRWFDFGPDERTTQFLEEQGISRISSNRRRYKQRVIPPGTELYVLGQASRRDDSDDGTVEDVVERLNETYDKFMEDLVIERDDGSGEYIVTDRGEDEISRHHFVRTVLYLAGGIVFVAIGATFLGLALQEYGML